MYRVLFISCSIIPWTFPVSLLLSIFPYLGGGLRPRGLPRLELCLFLKRSKYWIICPKVGRPPPPRPATSPATSGTSRNRNKSMILNYLEKSLHAQLLLEVKIEHFPSEILGNLDFRWPPLLGPVGPSACRRRPAVGAGATFARKMLYLRF